MRWARITVLAVGLATASAPPARASDDRRPTWVVQRGDALGTLAIRFGVSVSDLRAWNGLESDLIRVGQQLVVGATPSPAPPSPPPPAAPEAPAPEAEPALAYVVLRGDNLHRIAARVGVSLEALRTANPAVQSGRVRTGQTLRVVGATRVVDHEARRGETLTRLATLYEVAPNELLAWNPSLRTRALREGDVVRIYSDVRPSRSESIGAVNEGRLLHGQALPPHPGYIVRNRDRAFGTYETVQWMIEAFDALHDADPDAPRLRVHDLSARDGGRLVGHRSHQSGRDVDLAYFHRGCRRSPCGFAHLGPDELDARRTWRLLRYWLEAGVLDMVFVDHALQRPLYEEARRSGATDEQLARWFQYPRASDDPHGIIRHFRGHDDHAHVRFTCPTSDLECVARPQLSD